MEQGCNFVGWCALASSEWAEVWVAGIAAGATVGAVIVALHQSSRSRREEEQRRNAAITLSGPSIALALNEIRRLANRAIESAGLSVDGSSSEEEEQFQMATLGALFRLGYGETSSGVVTAGRAASASDVLEREMSSLILFPAPILHEIAALRAEMGALRIATDEIETFGSLPRERQSDAARNAIVVFGALARDVAKRADASAKLVVEHLNALKADR